MMRTNWNRSQLSTSSIGIPVFENITVSKSENGFFRAVYKTHTNEFCRNVKLIKSV